MTRERRELFTLLQVNLRQNRLSEAAQLLVNLNSANHYSKMGNEK